MSGFNADPAINNWSFDPTDDQQSVGRPVSALPISGSDIDNLLPPKTIHSRHWHLFVPDERDLPDLEDQIGEDE